MTVLYCDVVWVVSVFGRCGGKVAIDLTYIIVLLSVKKGEQSGLPCLTYYMRVHEDS